ncbi:MAG: hypothetical protein ACRD6W_04280, partial [Nitrososphaerales archaeon]
MTNSTRALRPPCGATSRKAALLVGLAFLLATVTFAVANSLIHSGAVAHDGALFAGLLLLGCTALVVVANGRVMRGVLAPYTPIRSEAYMVLRTVACLTLVGISLYFGRLSALALEAGDLLTTDIEVVSRTFVLPQNKGTIDMELRVTGPLAFLMAKIDALRGRDKPKDAYDIVWLVESWP